MLRLIHELATIRDLGVTEPALDALAFPRTAASDPESILWSYWSATINVLNSGGRKNLWTVSFERGSIEYTGEAATLPVRCVRGTEWIYPVEGRYQKKLVGNESIVLDKATGVIWQWTHHRTNWEFALDHCEGMIYAGYTDWRLPNINEILSLINFSRLPGTDCPGIPSSLFNTSTAVTDSEHLVWMYYTSEGGSYIGPMGGDPHTSCVRGGL